MAAAAIFDFQKLQILTVGLLTRPDKHQCVNFLTVSIVRRHNLHHRAKFCEDRSIIAEISQFF